MGEESDLVLLANVALNRPRTNGLKKARQKKREIRAKPLKVTNVNGENHADITDLTCMSMSTLCKIFVEKFEDKKSHSFIYVCKYEENRCCNTRFIDLKESRLEHLLQCHLLEHLTKTKTGCLIKLPKQYLENIPSMKVSEKIVQPESKCDNEEVQSNSKEQKTSESSVISIEDNSIFESVPASKKKIEIENIPKPVQDIPKPVRARTRPKNSKSSLNTDLGRVKFDHCYSDSCEPPSNIISVSSNKGGAIPIEYQSINVNKLYYLNGEPSSELNNFMIHETLNQAVSMLTQDKELTSEKLPLVGCEAEVTTESEIMSETVTDEFNLKSSYSYFPCSKCDIVFSAQQVLYAHMRNKHHDDASFKTYKESRVNRSSNSESKTAKRKFEIVTGYRNADLNEVVKENKGNLNNKKPKRADDSILKTALLKESNKKPVISISNIWNNINVQYL